MINLLWNGGEMPQIGRYGGHDWQTWFLENGCTSRAHTQYKKRLAIDWKATIKKAVTVIIMLATEQN